MSATEDLADTLASAERLLEAGRLFSRASLRAFKLLGMITNVRLTTKRTLPAGKEALEKEHAAVVIAALRDPKMSKIFKNPDEMRQSDKIDEAAKQMTGNSITSTENLVATASLVFAHAVFDATLFDYCRVTALCSWRDWLEVVKDRKVSIAEIGQATNFQTLVSIVDERVEELEKQSLMTKADMLHRIIKPTENKIPSTVLHYEYSPERLKSIDSARHEAVHRLQFQQGFTQIDDTIFYFHQTVFYFMGLVHRRYGVKIDANISLDDE